MMSGSTIIFYMLAALTLVSGIFAVGTRQIFRAAIFLLFSLIGVAGLYFWMQYEFIAAVQIVVYVGGITVLIIFSIFLTQQTGEKMPKQKIGRQIFSALAAFCGFALIMIQSVATYVLPVALTAASRTKCCQYWQSNAGNKNWRLCVTV